MAEYIVYVNVDQIRLGIEKFVMASFSRCGFTRAQRRDEGTLPLATLLFVGESSYSEHQLARHLEKALRFDTMCEIQVLVFRSDKLRSRREVQPVPGGLHLAPEYLN